jgi:hypothetical protein
MRAGQFDKVQQHHADAATRPMKQSSVNIFDKWCLEV